jgi:PBP1b-binding outer membrane lipoprotein LpoB
MNPIVIILAAALALTGCANTPTSYQSQLTALAAGVPVLEAALATYPGLVTPAVAKAEGNLNTALAALQASPAPTSAAAVLTDIRAVAAAMPASVLSPAHQAELSAALALAQVIAGALAGTPAAS